MNKIPLILGAFVVVLLIIFGGFVWDAFLVAPGPDAEQIDFTVAAGSSVKTISRDLKELGMIDSRTMFEFYAKIAGRQTDFQAGNFRLFTGMSHAALVAALTKAESLETQVTIPEGLTLAQIGEIIQANFDSVREEDWLAATGPTSPLFDSHSELLKTIPEGHDLEGYLFPDTYRFANEASAQRISEVMVETLGRRLEDAGYSIDESRTTHGLSFHELMTLASIVEREAQSAEDMKLAAGVFLTRLEIGMALQSDATVTYITGGKDPSPTFNETRVESPYNTYLHPGLPPGPVSHPGMNAILAVIDPTESDYLYFLTTDEGEFIYSKTFDEHVMNKNRYLK